MMRYKENSVRALLMQLGAGLCLVILLFIFSDTYSVWFAQTGFMRLQRFRLPMARFTILSIGDILYSLAFIYSLVFVFRFFRYRLWRLKNGLLLFVLKIVRAVLVFSIALYLLWGSLYSQPKLAERMGLDVDTVNSEALFFYDSVLIERMNVFAPGLHYPSYRQIKRTVRQVFYNEGGPRQLRSKASIFGASIAYFGIDGYFNPFTGESQANPDLPHYMHSFVVAHEYAHQMGVAAEDDANLKAYINCVLTNDTLALYSAYFNVWLYTQRRVMYIDSPRAKRIKEGLNLKTLAHLDTLRQRSEQYDNVFNKVSDILFDAYLKSEQQKDGIYSYRNMVYGALAWELKTDRLHLPFKSK